MIKEVLDFYAGEGLHLHKLISRAPSSLKKEQVEEAAVAIYNDILAGADISDMDIARAVWTKAKSLTGEKYAKRWDDAGRSASIIAGLTQQLEAAQKALDEQAQAQSINLVVPDPWAKKYKIVSAMCLFFEVVSIVGILWALYQ